MTLIGHIVDKGGNPLVGYIGGIKGNTGRGIASIVENGDYTITINLTDGTSYTTAPIAGFTALAFDANYDLVVTKTDGTTITVETDLNDYRSVLEGYKDDAESAKGDAETAQTYAESARDDAQTAKGKAEDAQDKAEDARDDAQTAQGLAETARDSASASALKAEQWAKGTKNGTPVSSGDEGYNDNSKYYSGLASNSATNAGTSESNASASASSASADALKAEGYAVGKQNGTDVTSGSPYYHNNSKYYSEEASDSATSASGSASSASADALVAEGWAKGEQNGTPVVSGDYYNDNAKYYAEQAGVSVASLQIVNTASGEIASFADGADSINMKSLVADINPVQDLNGYDAPWVGGGHYNQWDEEWEVGGYAGSNGAPWNVTDRIRSKTDHWIAVSPSTTYFMKCPTATVVCYFDTNKSFISSDTPPANNTFTTPQNARYIRFATYVQYGTTYNNDIAINYPSTVTTYTPYSNICPISGHDDVTVTVADDVDNPIVSETYTTTLPSTTYGGTLDLVSGELTVDRAIVDLGDLNYSYYNNRFDTTLSDIKGVAGWNQIYAICSALDKHTIQPNSTAYDGSFGIYNKTLFVRYNEVTSANAFKTAMSGHQLVYELATPTTYQLTPQQIQTILGQNNVWANSGDVSVKYVADTKLYIDTKIQELNVAILALA